MRSHPLESDCDDRGESWAEIVTLLIVTLLAGIAYSLWDNAIDAWHALTRRARQ